MAKRKGYGRVTGDDYGGDGLAVGPPQVRRCYDPVRGVYVTATVYPIGKPSPVAPEPDRQLVRESARLPGSHGPSGMSQAQLDTERENILLAALSEQGPLPIAEAAALVGLARTSLQLMLKRCRRTRQVFWIRKAGWVLSAEQTEALLPLTQGTLVHRIGVELSRNGPLTVTELTQRLAADKSLIRRNLLRYGSHFVCEHDRDGDSAGRRVLVARWRVADGARV